MLLDPRSPLDGECHAWGYSEREDGVAPTGSPASFLCEGIEGDDYLKLKAGQAAPGLSGAPLVEAGRARVSGPPGRHRGHRVPVTIAGQSGARERQYPEMVSNGTGGPAEAALLSVPSEILEKKDLLSSGRSA